MGIPASSESVSEYPAEEPAQPEGAPTAPKKQRFLRTRRVLRLRSVRLLLSLVCSALAAAGDESVIARIAEWARDHHLGPVVTFLENQQYKAHPPKSGGRPTIAPAPNSAPEENKTSARPALKPITPAWLVSPVGAPLPGEGTWQTLEDVDGTPALLGASLRPDNEHTSYVAAVVSMDQRGFDLNGTTRGTLTDGAASLVFTRDGKATISDWGRDATLTPGITGVRQNLKLIVDHGKVPDSVDDNVESGWGPTSRDFTAVYAR